LQEHDRRARFERIVMPHLAAAYNLARWLTGKDHDAEDLVQEAYLRAYKFFDRFQGDDGRAWLLAVVRNTCYTWLTRQQTHERAVSFQEEIHGTGSDALNPETLLLRKATRQLLHDALEELPIEFREVVVLRELEGFSYKEIAAIVDIPLGTVMSRLTRGRSRLQQCLAPRLSKELERDL
jgi:RNA polymerase sigma factor (sigma-70 family)